MSHLKRSLGVLALIVYYFSTIVGAGIFITPIEAMNVAGSASILSWVLILLISYPYALIFARIAQKYPVSGGIAKFIESEVSYKLGKSFALFYLLTNILSNPVLGFTAAIHLQSLLGFEGNTKVLLFGLGFMGLSSLFNLVGIGTSSRIQAFTLITLVSVVMLTIIISLPNVDLSRFNDLPSYNSSSIVSAAVVCFFSIVGWENVSSIAEEVRDPKRTFRKAILWSVIAISIFYLAIVLTVITVISPEQIARKATILSSLLELNFGSKVSKVGDCISILILILTMNAWIFGSSRMLFSLSRDGILPTKFAKICQKSNIPKNAVMIQLGAYAFVTFMMLLFNMKPEVFLEMCSLNYIVVYIIICFCAFRYFRSVLALISLIATVVFLPFNIGGLLYSVLLLCFSYIIVNFIVKKQKRSARVS